jgi:hypothetical protein
VKSKCLNREEFIVVGWTDPTGSRSHIGALLLGYYTEDGRLHYAGRAGTGLTAKELKRLSVVLKPLQVPRVPLAESPPRDSRFGSPLQLSRVHWVRPQVVVEATYLTWTEDNLLRLGRRGASVEQGADEESGGLDVVGTVVAAHRLLNAFDEVGIGWPIDSLHHDRIGSDQLVPQKHIDGLFHLS